MVHPHVAGAFHGQAVVLRIPVAGAAIIRVPWIFDGDIADDDVVGLDVKIAFANFSVAGDADQRGLGGHVQTRARLHVRGFGVRLSFADIDDAADLDDAPVAPDACAQCCFQLGGVLDGVDIGGSCFGAALGAAVLGRPTRGCNLQRRIGIGNAGEQQRPNEQRRGGRRRKFRLHLDLSLEWVRCAALRRTPGPADSERIIQIWNIPFRGSDTRSIATACI